MIRRAWNCCRGPWTLEPRTFRGITYAPLFVTSIVSVIIGYLILHQLDTGQYPDVDKIVAVANAVALTAIAVHMLVDRRLWDWTVMAVGVFWITTGFSALFWWLAWIRLFGRTSPRITEATLDVLRDMSLHGALPVMLMIAVYWYQEAKHRRWRKRRVRRESPAESVECEMLGE